jgi:hypothetical protein
MDHDAANEVKTYREELWYSSCKALSAKQNFRLYIHLLLESNI